MPQKNPPKRIVYKEKIQFIDKLLQMYLLK